MVGPFLPSRFSVVGCPLFPRARLALRQLDLEFEVNNALDNPELQQSSVPLRGPESFKVLALTLVASYLHIHHGAFSCRACLCPLLPSQPQGPMQSPHVLSFGLLHPSENCPCFISLPPPSQPLL